MALHTSSRDLVTPADTATRALYPPRQSPLTICLAITLILTPRAKLLSGAPRSLLLLASGQSGQTLDSRVVTEHGVGLPLAVAGPGTIGSRSSDSDSDSHPIPNRLVKNIHVVSL
jgi:hypothetical protein